MKKENSYKIKLLKILEILRQDSDEEKFLTTGEILKKLNTEGIICDRRTLSKDIKVLNSYGYEILIDQNIGMPNKYYIVDRSFDVPELRILIDAVEASSFITPRKTKQLIDKIANLGGSHRAEILKGNIIKFNTIKHSNEQIYYSINEIEQAIDEKKKISFYYFKYNVKKERIYQKDKKRYIENPYAMIYDNENYYLVVYNEKHNNITHYRIDRMEEVKIEKENRVLLDNIIEFDLPKHHKQVFGMFTGDKKEVRIQITENLIDVVLDKFGEDLKLIDIGNGWLEFTTTIQCSPQFYGWCCSFGNQLKIISPQQIINKMKVYIEEIRGNYE